MSKQTGIRRLEFLTVVLCLLFFIPSLSAQSEYADSLRRALPTANLDTNKVFLLNELAWELKFDAPDSARLLLNEALELAENLNWLKGQGNALNYRGVVEDIQGESNEAMRYFEKALVIRETLGDIKGQASLHNNLGNVYEFLGKYPEALRSYKLARRLRIELGDEDRALRALYNISITQESMGNYPEALDAIFNFLENKNTSTDTTEIANAYNVVGNIMSELDRFAEGFDYYKKAEKLHAAVGNEWELAGVLQNLGYIKDAEGEFYMDKDSLENIDTYFAEAIEYYELSLEMTQNLEDEIGQAETLNNLGATYKNLGSFYLKSKENKRANQSWKTALAYCESALKLPTTTENPKVLLELYNTIGDIKRRQSDYQGALKYARLCLDLSLEVGDKKFEQNAYKDLARAQFLLGDHKKAYESRKAYDELRYNRMNEEQIKDDERRLTIYSDNLKQLEIERQQQELALQEAQLARENILRNSALGGVVALALLAFLLYNRYRIKNQANRDLVQKNEIIEAERQRSESLLLNILPAATAAELKAKGKARARRYESVTVLFTDFKSFTQIAEQLSPEELVEELDTCFRAFDEIITRYGIEKIKTIGDAYMCAGGLPIENTDHPTKVVQAAIEMRDFMQELRLQQAAAGKPLFQLRIGVHTGSVVAGVVGSKKFAYDIWGDAVNIAARMESSGEVGKINISRQTYDLVKDKFECTPRGMILAKGKGEIEMFYV